MIRTTDAARRLVAALAAVLIAGIVGLGAVAGFSAPDRRNGSVTTALDHDGPAHPQLTQALASADDHVLALDLPAAVLDHPVGPGLAVGVAVVVAILVGRVGTRAPVPAGRAPPMG